MPANCKPVARWYCEAHQHWVKPPVAAEYMTVDQMAKKFGVGYMTIYRLIHAGDLEAVAFGRSFRISVDEVERFAVAGGVRKVKP